MTLPSDDQIALAFGEDTRQAGWRERVIERAASAFQDDGNPLLPWHALRLAAHWQQPVPVWVVDYLAERAELINEIVRDVSQSRAREAELIGKALGFGAAGMGKASVGAKAAADDRDYRIAVHVIGEIEKNKDSIGLEAIESAKAIASERFDVSMSTVNRAVDAWGEDARKHLGKLAAQPRTS